MSPSKAPGTTETHRFVPRVVGEFRRAARIRNLLGTLHRPDAIDQSRLVLENAEAVQSPFHSLPRARLQAV